MYLNVPVMLRRLDGQQNTHQIVIKFLYIICLVIVNQLAIEKNYYILALKFDDFAKSQWYMVMYYRDLHHKVKEINIVQKWPRQSNPLLSLYNFFLKWQISWSCKANCFLGILCVVLSMNFLLSLRLSFYQDSWKPVWYMYYIFFSYVLYMYFVQFAESSHWSVM